jgi:hypothetical protein
MKSTTPTLNVHLMPLNAAVLEDAKNQTLPAASTSWKRLFLVFAILTSFHFFSFAQTARDVLSNTATPIVYLGIDFTRVKVIDDLTTSAQDLRDRQFAALNGVIIDEAKKFNLAHALHRSFMDHNLNFVQKRNAKINPDQIMSGSGSDLSHLKAEDIPTIISGYDFEGTSGVGVVFIMEGMSKSAKLAAAWVTFVDMKTKKVLLTERIEGKPSVAFGFSKYWATTMHSMIETIEKKRYKEWVR